MERMPNDFVNALVLARRYRNYRYPEPLLHLVNTHRATAAAHLIHHIQRKHHRNVQLHQLERKIQISLDIGRINDIYYSARLFIRIKRRETISSLVYGDSEYMPGRSVTLASGCPFIEPLLRSTVTPGKFPTC